MTIYYKYDWRGFYDGETEQKLNRSTPTAPTNTTLTKVIGEPHSNWTGFDWIVIPYWEPEPRRVATLSKLEFRKRLGLNTLVAIENALPTDPTLRVLNTNMALAEFISLEDPDTISGIDYLVQKGLITSTQKDEILHIEVIPFSEPTPYPDEVVSQ
jgi:hypothetical protein